MQPHSPIRSDVSYATRDTSGDIALRRMSNVHIAYSATLMLLTAATVVVLAHAADDPEFFPRSPGTARPTAAWHAMLSAFAIVAGFLGSVLSIASILSARCLYRVRHRWFSIVVASANALVFPIGTIVSVWTLTALARPGVRSAYTEQKS